jgi:hypothetical protein
MNDLVARLRGLVPYASGSHQTRNEAYGSVQDVLREAADALEVAERLRELDRKYVLSLEAERHGAILALKMVTTALEGRAEAAEARAKRAEYELAEWKDNHIWSSVAARNAVAPDFSDLMMGAPRETKRCGALVFRPMADPEQASMSYCALIPNHVGEHDPTDRTSDDR